MSTQDEDELLRSVAIQNAQSILAARQRAERELIDAKEALEARSAELARSLAMMRATLESATDGIVVIDGDGKIATFNDKFLEMWRLPREEVEAASSRRLIEVACRQFGDPAGFLARLEAINAASPGETFDLLEFADGRVLERYSKIQLVDGRYAGRVWTFRDITQRRRAEAALEDETRVLELLNRTGAAIGAQLDLQAVVQTVTDAATEASGAKFGAFFYNVLDEHGESFVLSALSGAPRAAFEKFGLPRNTPIFNPTFRGEGIVRSADITRDPRYGTMPPHHGMPKGHVPVKSYLAVPVTSRTGGVIGGLFFGHSEAGVFTDRSERLVQGIAGQAAVAIDNARLYDSERQARAEAERMGAIKDEFLATLSHELRTPLGAILGWAQVLRARAMDEASLRHALDVIERNARAQTQLIDDLLDMSRITSGKVRLDIQPLAPASFIEAALETVRPAADAKSIRLVKLLDPDAGPVSGDPHRLQQIVWNLLSNAIKFTPKGGKVEMVLQRVNSHIEISVADTGIGIKPEFLSQVFDRFRQGDASTTRKFGGLGLGLSIVRHLVELHGGTVQASSAGEGRGATFTVLLPLTVVHRKPDAAPREHPRTPRPVIDLKLSDLSGVRILVVDDQADARDLFRRILEECGSEVVSAATVDEAVDVFKQGKVDLLLSDIGMPGKDGFELLQRVRALGAQRGGNIPAIALTAFARSEDRTRALRAGFLVHISKPVEPAELIATVASVLGRTGEPSS